MQILSKPLEWEIPSRLACTICAIFTLIYSESGTSLTFGAGPGTGEKQVNKTQFFRLGILHNLSRRSVYFGNFPV